jgi:hypothetical protein
MTSVSHRVATSFDITQFKPKNSSEEIIRISFSVQDSLCNHIYQDFTPQKLLDVLKKFNHYAYDNFLENVHYFGRKFVTQELKTDPVFDVNLPDDSYGVFWETVFKILGKTTKAAKKVAKKK